MNTSLTKQVLSIIREYIKKNEISMSEFAKRAHVSKSWLSKLQHTDANLSIEMANDLLDVMGYKLVIQRKLSKNSRLTRNNLVIICQNIQ